MGWNYFQLVYYTYQIKLYICIYSQVSVALQSEEEIKNKDSQNISDNAIKPITFARHHEVTIGLSRSQLILPIPLHITPAFETDLGMCIVVHIPLIID